MKTVKMILAGIFVIVMLVGCRNDGGTDTTPVNTAPTGTNPDTTPPTVPANFLVTALSSTQIRLEWIASTDNVGVTGYNIYEGPDIQHISSQGWISSTNTSTVMSGLTASTQYCMSVSAIDAAGNESADTDAKCIITLADPQPPLSSDTTTPTAPTGVQITFLTSTQVALIWSASSDVVGVSGYNIYATGDNQLRATYTTITAVIVSNLTSSINYCFTVTAYDNAGNESVPSAQVCAVTREASPPYVSKRSPDVDAVNVPIDSTISATFSEPMDPNTITISNISLTSTNGVTGGTVSYVSSMTEYKAIFTPTVQLATNTKYTVMVSNNVSDATGNRMVVNCFWSFTTAP